MRATIKLVIYTLVGSLLMLAAAIATGVLAAEQSGGHITFALSSLQAHPLGGGSQDWIFLFFAAAFLVKMPAFPLHGWMPDGYRAMPIEVLMVFSGVLSKVGAYGFLAIVLPLFPHASAHFQLLILLIALASIVYGSLEAFSQSDARLIAGYSSVAQLGFITLGVFSLNSQGAQGALFQMVNHGLVVAALLFIIALLAQRAGGSEDIREMGGIALRAPVLATLFLVVSLATLAMPGSSNFVGEFLILLGVFKAKLVIAILAFSGVVLASVYALRLFIRSMHNRPGARTESRDLGVLDAAVLAPLVAVIVFLAVYPQLALHRSEGSVKSAVARAQTDSKQGFQTASLPSAGSQRFASLSPGCRRAGGGSAGAVVECAGELDARGRAVSALATAHLKGPHIDFAGLSPLVALLGGAVLVLMLGLLARSWARTQGVPALTLVVLAAALGLTIWQWDAQKSVVSGALRIDDLSLLLTLILIVGGAFAVLLAWRSLAAREAAHGEFHALLLTSIAGMSLLASAQNTVALFIGLELLSIPLYVLCATEMRREHSLESGLKYLIIGSVGSATLLYGLALIYGATGATDFAAIDTALSHGGLASDPLTLTGVALCVAGLCFKASVAPFHQWTPDVYEGAPTPVTAFMAVATKVADVRRVPAPLRRRADRNAVELGARPGRARHDHDPRGQRRGARAVLDEADARLLVGRAGRVHARRRGRRLAPGRAGDGLLPRGLPVHEHGRLRRDRHPRAPDGARRLAPGARGPRPREPPARVADDDRDARPRRASPRRPASSGSST